MTRPVVARQRLLINLLILLFLVFSTAALADEFILHNGGRIVGELVLDPLQPSVTAYQVRTPSGGMVTIDRKLVRELVRSPAAEQEYERRVGAIEDTVEGHWELAQWCLQQRLEGHREAHLQRILELDPDHIEARRGLGYQHVHGRWVQQEDFLRDRGFQRHEGRWRLSQEIHLLEEQGEQKKIHNQWLQTLKRHRDRLRTRYAQDALWQIASIRDPQAVGALAAYLSDEKKAVARLAYVRALGGIGTPAAMRVLVQVSLREGHSEISRTARQYVIGSKPPFAVSQYVQALKSPDNQQVKRAASALGELEDPSAVRPLIDALVTTHVLASPAPAAMPTTSTTFVRSDDGSGGPGPLNGHVLQSGGDAPVQYQVVRNQEVHDALVQLSGGVSFGFNQQAWINWHALQKQQEHSSVETRRDGN